MVPVKYGGNANENGGPMACIWAMDSMSAGLPPAALRVQLRTKWCTLPLGLGAAGSGTNSSATMWRLA